MHLAIFVCLVHLALQSNYVFAQDVDRCPICSPESRCYPLGGSRHILFFRTWQ